MTDPTDELEIQTFASVWDAIADTPAEAANLKLRSELMHQIAAIVTEIRRVRCADQRPRSR
ncbi:hypothetical protein [uncultured Lamprocystis sp.]|jgi:predicted XRE-type DNA-binding protein|uniref:hypothetical protein n=1 Tax=uncultured Lamprocystis sp. TaxID=543132 RepID=UPI0025CBA021|nr:hypothetical protein [uncultured Lamprocystis sp.]